MTVMAGGCACAALCCACAVLCWAAVMAGGCAVLLLCLCCARLLWCAVMWCAVLVLVLRCPVLRALRIEHRDARLETNPHRGFPHADPCCHCSRRVADQLRVQRARAPLRGGEPRLTAAAPVGNPYCSCKLTRQVSSPGLRLERGR